jgi:ribonuclease BN (tRNA processing enzyme)
MAACRADTALFGGDTSCYMVRAGEETVFLDAGSGLCSAPARYPKPPVILLSHLHLDHVIGLGMFPGFVVPGQRARLYVPFCETGEEAALEMERVFSPPFWPLRLNELEGSPELLPLPRCLQIGDLLVEGMEGEHPNRAMILRLSFDGRSIVYATDYEHTEPSFSRLVDFARDADLLLYDAQFTAEQYPSRRGFGHSTAEKGLELMRRSGAKKLLLVHHAPVSTDADLLQREKTLEEENAVYAREGQTFTL